MCPTTPPMNASIAEIAGDTVIGLYVMIAMASGLSMPMNAPAMM
jgi:hypothetical protein